VTLGADEAMRDVRMLALGDSYTIGESVAEDEQWPNQFAELLRERQYRLAAPTIVARTGWTTDELSAGIDAGRPGGVFDLVTLLIGVNDQYRGRTSADYRTRFSALLARAVAFAGGRAQRVIVLSIPDWGVTPFAAGRDRKAIAAEIDAFNAVGLEETVRAGAHFVDITPISRRAATASDLIAADGLHPSGHMYAEWARVVLPVVLSALGDKAF
jgi:lysophospholipase L1-like esterase